MLVSEGKSHLEQPLPEGQVRTNSIESDLQLLVSVLPPGVQQALKHFSLDELIEIVMDLGRLPEARFANGTIEELGDVPITDAELNHVVERIGQFTSDNRAGIPKTLHRISCIRNRQGRIVGLTCRVGKALTGTIECIKDLVESERSILLLGRPGVGKTTRLREISKLMADELRKRVVVVDTSNEIAGDGDIPHPAVGRARRMQVPSPELQQNLMIEAVENHTPQVIVVDEIGTEEEAMASRTIAERGVILVATAHGSTLENLIKNPVLSDLIGGIQTVTLGDDEAKRRGSQKTVLERAKKPTFDVIIEIRDKQTLAVYENAAEAVDHLLRGWTLFPEVRKVDIQTGTTRILKTDVTMVPPATDKPAVDPAIKFQPGGLADPPEPDYKIFLYGITQTFVKRILDRLLLNDRVAITENIHEAHAAMALRGKARPGSKFLLNALNYEVPIFYVKDNSLPQIQRALRETLESLASDDDAAWVSAQWSNHLATQSSGTAASEQMGETDSVLAGVIPIALHQKGNASTDDDGPNETTQALHEAAEAIKQVLSEGRAIKLDPRRSYIRRLQHELVEKHQLNSVSVGDEPNRRLKILPPKKKKS